MSEPWRLSLSDGLRKIEEGGLSATEWTRSLLERIDALEEKILAWAHVDGEGALAEAGAIDERLSAGEESGSLAGGAVGYKDIVDVVGLPREANSPLLKGEIADEDATVTTRLKDAGAICLGKTVTTQFATSDPSQTRNPWNLKRSPGGSSSGSAAAVAAGMVPAALGSQTGGSTLRPAAFCGVVGLKPTYGRIPRSGLISVSWNLDHVGVITRNTEDAARVLTAVSGADGIDAQAPDVSVPDYAEASAPLRPRRACFWKEDLLPHASEEVAGRIEECVAELKAKGVAVEEARLPVDVEEMHAAHRIIMRVEAAAYHDKMFLENQDAYAPHIRKNISTGLMTPAVHYVNALRFRARFIQRMADFFQGFDLVILPSHVERPPIAEESTGNALFNEPFTQIGFPAISLPVGRGDENLPIGIQLSGRRFGEAALLSAARWCEAELGWVAEFPDVETVG
ncbi:MAG: amidase [Nitrospinae bacterium]|nr:amidase [Nitrospinota bacterium]